MTVDETHVLKIWENYVQELYDRAKKPENLDFETEKDVDEDEKALEFGTLKWKQL